MQCCVPSFSENVECCRYSHNGYLSILFQLNNRRSDESPCANRAIQLAEICHDPFAEKVALVEFWIYGRTSEPSHVSHNGAELLWSSLNAKSDCISFSVNHACSKPNLLNQDKVDFRNHAYEAFSCALSFFDVITSSWYHVQKIWYRMAVKALNEFESAVTSLLQRGPQQPVNRCNIHYWIKSTS
jgi:hypothetical protein